jgi:hypothetical protein
MGSAIPLCGQRTCHGIEEERVLASVSTIVVVAGQTQVHTVSLLTVHPAIVPPIVPGLVRQECRRHRKAEPIAYIESGIELPIRITPGNGPARTGSGRRVRWCWK